MNGNLQKNKFTSFIRGIAEARDESVHGEATKGPCSHGYCQNSNRLSLEA